VRPGNRLNWLAIFSGVSLLAAVVLMVVELVFYSRSFSTLPAGLSLGNVPVGGLTEQAAQQQLLLVYRSPVQLRYRDQVILLDPSAVNFQVDTNLMLPQVNQFRTNAGFWSGFWEYLWLQPGQSNNIPLQATYSHTRLRAFLQDVAARYDQPGSPPKADPNKLGFQAGEPGHALDLEAAVSVIDASLVSPTKRTVDLPVTEQTALRPGLDTLDQLIRQDVSLFQFSGVFSMFLADMRTGKELEINLRDGESIDGPIAFSGMSTIKIPIMVSFFGRTDAGLSDEDKLLLKRTIDESANSATDLLLKTIGHGDGYAGTRQVTANMQRLGLPNTYLSGLLDVLGAVLLPIPTPANSRTDINTQPDPYDQTTAEDMGALLEMIYQCSQGGGALLAAFPGSFSSVECRQMIDYLTGNLVGPIFISGGSTPSGVVAHKHGWDRLPLNNVADAAIVFTPGGTYILTMYVHRDDTMTFDEANRLIISVARAVYNYYNPGG
jgi:beta-lactamase class A